MGGKRDCLEYLPCNPEDWDHPQNLCKWSHGEGSLPSVISTGETAIGRSLGLRLSSLPYLPYPGELPVSERSRGWSNTCSCPVTLTHIHTPHMHVLMNPDPSTTKMSSKAGLVLVMTWYVDLQRQTVWFHVQKRSPSCEPATLWKFVE